MDEKYQDEDEKYDDGDEKYEKGTQPTLGAGATKPSLASPFLILMSSVHCTENIVLTLGSPCCKGWARFHPPITSDEQKQNNNSGAL